MLSSTWLKMPNDNLISRDKKSQKLFYISKSYHIQNESKTPEHKSKDPFVGLFSFICFA